MSFYYYSLFWVCIIGLIMGSFFNVVILRSLANESIVFPPSKCPKCQNRLLWWHNIPVLSYILLRGKCYFCKEKISIQYPIIEIITMLAYAITFIKFGFSVQTIFVIIWISGFIIMSMTDLKEKLVDCNIAIFIAILALIYHFILSGWNGVLFSFLGLLLGALILEIFARSGFIIAKTRAMGEADTYVAGAIGAIVGLKYILPVLLYALIASMLFIVPMFLYCQFKLNNKKVCILSVLFMLSIVIFKTLVQNYYSLAFLFLTGLFLSISILQSIKQEQNRNYLPYVPALVIGALYFIFFSINF